MLESDYDSIYDAGYRDGFDAASAAQVKITTRTETTRYEYKNPLMMDEQPQTMRDIIRGLTKYATFLLNEADKTDEFMYEARCEDGARRYLAVASALIKNPALFEHFEGRTDAFDYEDVEDIVDDIYDQYEL